MAFTWALADPALRSLARTGASDFLPLDPPAGAAVWSKPGALHLRTTPIAV